ncbi:MAG: hypothetical protein KBT30_01490 [Clostridiales bacterium]|nr:hypothetical protein [Candidatus Apopatousia equi]
MNRSNIGNIATNALQIASIGTTTLSGAMRGARRDDAASRLTQQREDRASQLFELQKEGLQAKNEALKSKADIASQKLETEKLRTEKTRLDTERKQQIINKNKEVSVDEAASGAKEIYKNNGEQVSPIISKEDFDINLIKELLNKRDTQKMLRNDGYVVFKKSAKKEDK